MSNAPLRAVGIRIPEPTYRKLKKLSTANNRSVAGEIRHLITLHVEENK